MPDSTLTHLLAKLVKHGCVIDPVAINSAMTARPSGFATMLRFGDRVEGSGAGSIAEVEIEISLRGDLTSNDLRRWRIIKVVPLQHSLQEEIRMNVVLTLAGDMSSDFVRREGRTALRMMSELLEDAKKALAELRTVRRNALTKPVVQLMTKVAGDIAIGRGGLAHSTNGPQSMSFEGRAMRRMICDHLMSVTIPQLMLGASGDRRDAFNNAPTARSQVLVDGVVT